MDDDLFTHGKIKAKLSKRQRREGARQWAESQQRKSDQEKDTLGVIDQDGFRQLQKKDPSLQEFWKAAADNDVQFVISNGLLQRRPPGAADQVMQLVVPVEHRKEVLKLAHGAPLAEHLGIKKTLEKVRRYFYWPTVNRDVKEYCGACPECQRGSNGNRTKAPLQPLPSVGEPFKRVAVDLVGPLRRTQGGHRYILTLIDMATRYPEAVPLRRIDASTVAEAICEIFSRFGIPEEILSDQGSQFMGSLMEKTMDILGVRTIHATPYHPQTNGCLERFHGTLKMMLRKREGDKRQWNQWLPYVCFAYRDAPRDSALLS